MDKIAEVKKILRIACQFNNEHAGCDTLEDGDCLQADCQFINEQVEEIRQLFEPDVCPECKGEKTIIRQGRDFHCPTCKGTGKYSETGRGSDGFERCPDCEGKKQVRHFYSETQELKTIDCPICHSTGIKPQTQWCPAYGYPMPCAKCEGMTQDERDEFFKSLAESVEPDPPQDRLLSDEYPNLKLPTTPEIIKAYFDGAKDQLTKDLAWEAKTASILEAERLDRPDREKIARIICCFAEENNNCEECKENTHPELKFPNCFPDIRDHTDQILALIPDKDAEMEKKCKECKAESTAYYADFIKQAIDRIRVEKDKQCQARVEEKK